jgi:AAA+ ATPase superfamily predicted ATPase
MARDLEPVLGVRPQLDDLGALFTTLFRLARDTKALVVIDEFPYLLGSTATEQNANLTTIQAVLEQERDSSQVKLILAGSTISTMQDLLNERNPLHGRLVSFQLKPLDFSHARQLMGKDRPGQGPEEELAHFAIAGGMPRYLRALDGKELLRAVTDTVLDPGGALFNEPRAVVASELREPAMYSSILAALAVKPAAATEIAATLRLESRDLNAYLAVLESLQLITRYESVGARPRARGTSRWRCDDDFVRFWFRFVEPYQGELEAGADPRTFLQRRVVPALPEHVSITFERVVADWMRQHYREAAPTLGPWWGNALDSLRRDKQRFTEEIDVVVLDGKRVLAVAEAKWTNSQMPADVLTDLDNYKLPALAQAGFQVSGAEIVLAAKSGFTRSMKELAAGRPKVRLLPATDLLADL